MISYAITDRQREIMSFLVVHHEETGMIASVREIQKHFGFSSSNAVASHLRALEQKGFIKRSIGKARSIVFLLGANRERRKESAALNHTNRLMEEYVDQMLLPISAQRTEKRDVKPPLAQNPIEQAISLDRLAKLIHADSLQAMRDMEEQSVHAIVTDPPYGLIEYDAGNHAKLREGRGGVWRIPPKLNGVERSPLPRFTVLGPADRDRLVKFFHSLGELALRVLVPGGHLIIASNPLLSTSAFSSIAEAGMEKRGEIIRLVSTLRGGDRPKGAEDAFPEVSVMPRSCWEPWGLFRKPLSERTVKLNLERWGTGALRRPSRDEPFKDVLECSPARGAEREAAPHPSIKPQKLLRMLVRASLPMGKGVVLDPFAGSGSTLAAASAIGYESIGIERDLGYIEMAKRAFVTLKSLPVPA
ncbi:DNA methyltransferase [Prosthecobacter sp.]|uniref:DNA methyltransferase n=1 Tax=Prosthecobacter sp. TaxID=1965333 RepID=UPI003783EB66